MPTESPFINHLSADQVAIQIGISIPRLRTLRRDVLHEGPDWIRDPQDDRRTLFSPAGVARIRQALSGTPTPLEASPEAIRPPSPSSPEKIAGDPSQIQPDGIIEEILTVVSSPRVFPGGEVKHHPNPRVISARRVNGDVVYVRVSESRNFVSRLPDGSPMTLRARLEGTPPNWSLIGRCPRWLGRG